MKKGWRGIFEIKHYNVNGDLVWSEEAENSLADEGENFVLDEFFRAATAPTQFFIRLTNTVLSDTSTLTTASAGEPSTNGYAAQLVERSATGWPSLALDSGDWQLTSSEETFNATGGSWGPVDRAFLGTTSNNTGKLIAYATLSQSRTLANGESLKVTYRVKLQ